MLNSMLSGGITGNKLSKSMAVLSILIAIFIGVALPALISSATLLYFVVGFIGVLGLIILAVKWGKWLFMGYIAFLPGFGMIRSLSSDTPQFATSFSPLAAIKDVLIFVLLIALLISLFQKRKLLRFPNYYFTIPFLFIAFIAAMRTPNLVHGIWALRNVYEFFLVYILAVNLIRDRGDAIRLLKIILLVGIIFLGYGLYIASNTTIGTGAEIYGGSRYHIVGRLNILGDYTTAGLYSSFAALISTLAVGFILFPSLNFRNVGIIGMALSVATVILTFERRGVIALTLVLVLSLIYARRLTYLVIVTPIVVIGGWITILWKPKIVYLITLRLSLGDVRRVEIWRSYLNRLGESFLLGMGLGSAGNTILAFTNAYIFTPHNYYLLLLFQGGVIFVFLFLIMSAKFLLDGLRRALYGVDDSVKMVGVTAFVVLLSILVQSLTSDFLEIFLFSVYFWLFSALASNFALQVRRN